MITLLLGGARSGKSELGERLASASARENRCGVTYIATMISGDDVDLAKRIAAHRARRPATWTTVQADADLPAMLETLSGTVLLDSLGPWLAAQPDFAADVAALCDALRRRSAAGREDTIVVSDEVGLGVHPATPLGGAFRDALGSANRAVAAVADRALLVVAGRALALDRPPDR